MNILAIKSKNLQVQYVDVGVIMVLIAIIHFIMILHIWKNIWPTMVDAIVNFSTKNPVLDLDLAPRTKTWLTVLSSNHFREVLGEICRETRPLFKDGGQ